MDAGKFQILTTVWLSNVHSSSVRAIMNALNALSPPPTQVQVSVVAKSVTLCHPKQLDLQTIHAALHRAGFDVVSRARFPPPRKPLTVHMSPKKSTQYAVPSLNPIDKDDVDDIFKTKVDLSQGVDATDSPLRVTLSVGGMTCAACSGRVTETLSRIDGVSEPTVNLLGASAVMVVNRKCLIQSVVDAVEDSGYEAQVYNVESISDASNSQPEESARTISLRVDGMFSPNCPQTVMTSLKDFKSKITVIKPLENTDPILRISYRPSVPDFTIRHIVSAIASAKSPPYRVSVHHPPSIEELGREMHRRYQRDILLRLLFSIVVAIPTFVIGILYMSLVKDSNRTKHFFMQPMWVGNVSRSDWALMFLATPVMFYSANVFHLRAYKEIVTIWRKGSTTPILYRFIRFGSMNLLVSTGVSVAYFASLALLGLAAAQPKQEEGDTTSYFDSVVFLTMFLLAGRWLEAYSKSRTGDAIAALGTLRPSEALVLVPAFTGDSEKRYSSDYDIEKGDPTMEDGSSPTLSGLAVEKISTDLLEVGDVVRVHKGSTPPADGIVVEGQDSAFDESSLTGESKLIQKKAGDSVFLGTINSTKPVDIQITAVNGNTTLDHIIGVVRDGLSRRAPIERIANLITGYFVPIATLLAILTWAVWFGLGFSGVLPADYLDIHIGGWAVWSLQFSIAVFVVACPCGIGLAAPTALLVGSGVAANLGILARGGGEAFQEMAQVDIMVFDKTGTLTEGGPRVSDSEILYFGDDGIEWNPRLVLGIAAQMESASSHPLAKAIKTHCQSQRALPASESVLEEVAGRGLKAHFASHHCTAIIGNEAWMSEHGVSISPHMSQRLNKWKGEAKSVVLLAIRHEIGEGDEQAYKMSAIFAITDPLRREARDVVRAFQRRGIATWMISGDNKMTAIAVARAAGIPLDNVIAGVLPHEKAEKIKWLQHSGAKRKRSKWLGLTSKRRLNDRSIVAMVGDGINDAPALTASDIGIAIGSGSDIAISSASFVLMSSDLLGLLNLSDLSKKVFRRIIFNFAWAGIYNAIALPIAAGVLYPLGHIRLNPVWASLAMALSSISVICSSLLLKLHRFKVTARDPTQLD